MAKDYKLRCPRCGSENVTAQVVSEQMYVEKGKKSLFYKLLIGWWIWIVALPIKALFKPFHLFGTRDKKYTNTEHHTECVCQNCGHHWAMK